jgi:hypothetical protein
VFLGYCANCADYEYNGERGRGFIDCGREDEAEEVKHFPSAFDTYLKDVSLDDVGDKDFMDSAKMLLIEEANAYIEACEWEEPDSEDESVEVGWCIDRCGGGYGSNFNGGYDSY